MKKKILTILIPLSINILMLACVNSSAGLESIADDPVILVEPTFELNDETGEALL